MLKTFSKNDYTECLNKVENISWVEFVERYPDLAKKYDEQIIYMAYLTGSKEKILGIEDQQEKSSIF